MTVIIFFVLFLSWQATYSMEAGNQLIQDINEKSPLIQVVKSHDCTLKKVKRLITANNEIVHDQDMHGCTALALAIPRNETKIISLLLDFGADINKANNEGVTPLMVAMRYGSESLIKYLITKKAKIDASDSNGNTALLRIISNHLSNKIRIMLLIKNGADIEKANNKGFTPLMAAVSHTDGKILVKRLITFGVNVLAKDSEGKTALMHAQEKNAPLIIIKRLCSAEREQMLMDSRRYRK